MKNKWIYWCGLAILVFFCLPATVWAEATEAVGVAYRGHIQNIGDYPLDGTWVNSPEPIGTVGQSKRIEGFEIKLTGAVPADMELRYNVHVQNKGWLYDEDDVSDWPKDGAYAGTRGQGLRIEAVKLVLTDADGQVYPGYSVQYRGHVQNVGDLPAAAGDYYADGQQLGTVGSSLRLEALLVTVVKTAVEPAETVVYETAGSFGPAEGSQTLAGDVVVAADGVVLNNLVIDGNLTIAETVGDGNVTLNNVTVKGDTLVRGGGVNSIHINGGQYGRIMMEKTASGGVRIVAVDAAGLEVVITDAAVGETVILEGAFASVTVNAPNMTVTTQGATTTIGALTVGADAGGSTLNLASGTTVTELVLEGKAAVKGQGTVSKAEVQADGVVFEKKPDTYTVAPEVQVPPVIPSDSGGGGYTPPSPPSPVAVTGVSLDFTTLDLPIGDSAVLTATLAPANASNQAVTFSSSDTNVAEVDADGFVLPRGLGTATITVTTQDGGKTATCVVTVKDLCTFITGLTIPFHGDKPDVEIDAINQYTGAVTWREQGGSVDLQDTDHFDGAKTYVATITLSMIAPYSVADIDANCFTVAGATTTNGANTAVVTAVFAPVEQYRIDNTGLITAYSGPGGELVIPDSIFNSTNVETTVTGIGERVFYDRGLTRVTLPGAVNIADAAFSGDPLTKITIGNNTTISNVADTMGVYGSAFYAYYESSVAGKPARSPGQYVYESGAWQFDNGLSFSGATITAYDKTKGPYAFIPKTGAGTDITAIADGDTNNSTGVLSDSSLTTLTFASDSQLTTIGSLAFARNQLACISLPDTVETIGFAAFFFNQQLKNVTLSSGLKTIDSGAFQACRLETLTLPNGLETIGASAFAYNNLAGMLIIPASVTEIDVRAFWDNAITSLVIEETAGTPSTLVIQRGAFEAEDASKNPITRITIPAGVLIIDDAATMGYYGANFKAAYTAGGAGIYNYDSGTDSWIKETIPVGVTAPFNGVAPNTDITTDAQGRFTGTVIWTEDGTGNGVMTFDGSKAYTATMTLTAAPGYQFAAGTDFAVAGADTVTTTIGTNGLTATVTANYGVKDRYVIDENGVITAYSGPGGELVVPGSIGTITVTGIGDSAFEHNDSPIAVTLPATVTAIGNYAFYDCTGLVSLTFEAGSQLTTIGEYAFYGCNKLASLTLPATVTAIGGSAFNDCNFLVTLTFEGVSQLGTIGDYAFSGCSKLAALTLPANVTTIGSGAFENCTGLGTLTFKTGSQLEKIGVYAFSGCPLISLSLPANVTIPDSSQTGDVTMGLYGAAFKSFYESTGTGGNNSAGGTFVYNTTTNQWSKNP